MVFQEAIQDVNATAYMQAPDEHAATVAAKLLSKLFQIAATRFDVGQIRRTIRAGLLLAATLSRDDFLLALAVLACAVAKHSLSAEDATCLAEMAARLAAARGAGVVADIQNRPRVMYLRERRRVGNA